MAAEEEEEGEAAAADRFPEEFTLSTRRRLRFFVCLAMTIGGVARAGACLRRPGNVFEYSVLDRLLFGLWKVCPLILAVERRRRNPRRRQPLSIT